MSKQYSMKVYPAGRGRDVYRNIEICGNESLDRLCETILEAFDFILSGSNSPQLCCVTNF